MSSNSKFKWVGSLMNGLITISIFVIFIICLIGIVLCIGNFINNQKSFYDTYTEAINAITSTVSTNSMIENESITAIMTHMENLQVIQKNSITNDLMSFVYGILSTVLVGLCAGFVAKSKKSADESKETAKQAQINAQTVEETKNDMLKLKEDVIHEVENSNNLRKCAEEQMKIQNNNTKLLEVHIAIAYAKISLFLCDQVDANSRIYGINKEINSFEGFFNKQAIKQLCDELLILKSFVDEFKNKAKQSYTNGKQTSMLQAALRYYKELDQSIFICNSLISK